MRSTGWVTRIIGVVLALSLGACGGLHGASGGDGTGAGAGSGGDPAGAGGGNVAPTPDEWSSGACHVAPAPTRAECTSAPARLTQDALTSDFFADVWSTTGLTGAVGRRVTFGDVDGDHFPDFVNIETGVTRGLQHLWLNRADPATGKRTFVEATAESGITRNRAGGEGQTALMVTFADVDNDGDLDLFSGSYSQASDPSSTKYVADPNELYLNDGKGHFTLAQTSGLNAIWPYTTAAAVFTDVNRDGKLDLYVGGFMKDYPNLDAYQDRLFLGDGVGGFKDATGEMGLLTPDALGAASGNFPKPTYGATACDWDDDGDPDLLVSSYALMADDLWRNDDGHFVNASEQTKFAQDDHAMPGEASWRQGGNGFSAACADYDNDGDLDVMTSETTHGDYPRSEADRSRILRNTGKAGGYTFERPELTDTGIYRDINGTGPDGEHGDEGDHGASWFDLDNDGLLDLVIEQSAYPGNHAWFFYQQADHRFVDVTDLSGVAPSTVASNGLTVDDFDRDGDLDVLMGSVNNVNGVVAPENREQLHLYENKVGQKKHFLHVTLKGLTANRQGIGARVKVTAGCLTQTREISGGKGTFGASDPAYAHFGLGDVDRIDTLEVRWPTNPPKVDVFHDVAADQFLEITEGSPDLSCEAPNR